MRDGFDNAGFPSINAEKGDGLIHTMPEGNSVRTMDPSETNPRRAIFQNKNGEPVGMDFKPVQPHGIYLEVKKQVMSEKEHI